MFQRTTTMLAALVVASGAAAAQQNAYDYLPGSAFFFNEGFALESMTGWEFRPGAEIEVTSLAVWDEPEFFDEFRQPGLVNDVVIGIWDSTGNLLRTETIAAGTEGTYDATTEYRSFSINPLVLDANQNYVIARIRPLGLTSEGTFDPSPDMQLLLDPAGIDDVFLFEDRLLNPLIEVVQGRFTNVAIDFGDPTLSYNGIPSFPTRTVTNNLGFGAGVINFGFNVVPAPSSALALLGGALCAARRRR